MRRKSLLTKRGAVRPRPMKGVIATESASVLGKIFPSALEWTAVGVVRARGCHDGRAGGGKSVDERTHSERMRSRSSSGNEERSAPGAMCVDDDDEGDNWGCGGGLGKGVRGERREDGRRD